ncbi:MAG: thioredoxin domain-containing protein [Alphaproteobacteria bacterium]|nr:thioredoxin domain-containing protein [Alphaproteobacteria bacterium]
MAPRPAAAPARATPPPPAWQVRARGRLFGTALAIAASVALGSGPALAQSALPGSFSAEQRAAIEAIVRELLVRDPTLLRDAISALQARQDQEAAREQSQMIATYRRALVADPADPVLGNPQGDVTLVEFSDYRCPVCTRAQPIVAEVLARDPRLRLVVKEVPVIRPDSVFGARAALAAQRQGRYEAMRVALFRHQDTLSDEVVLRIAREAGLDVARFRRDYADPAVEARVAENLTLARAIGLSATPTFVLGERMIPGLLSPADLLAMVAELRGQARR